MNWLQNMNKFYQSLGVAKTSAPLCTFVSIVAIIRLLSGNMAVHSDMIMWHKDETTENAARQILNSIFATLQLSVKLEEQSRENLEMIRFWTTFAKENSEILQHGKLMPQEPQNLYPVITAQKDGAAVTAVYSSNRVVPVSGKNHKTILINGVKQLEIIIRTEKEAVFHLKQRDCRGRVIYEKTERLESGFHNLDITESGLLELECVEG
ncbi:MAG: hypothetical protein WCD89_11170 [Anaerocolumna sp.]